ncbi:hypothetical protein FB451DRAFT_1518485, partial [Mycena latifolia]
GSISPQACQRRGDDACRHSARARRQRRFLSPQLLCLRLRAAVASSAWASTPLACASTGFGSSCDGGSGGPRIFPHDLRVPRRLRALLQLLRRSGRLAAAQHRRQRASQAQKPWAPARTTERGTHRAHAVGILRTNDECTPYWLREPHSIVQRKRRTTAARRRERVGPMHQSFRLGSLPFLPPEQLHYRITVSSCPPLRSAPSKDGMSTAVEHLPLCTYAFETPSTLNNTRGRAGR